MGIQGLLPLLKPIQRRRHLSEFAGQTLAVDAYVWLHRGAYACATELVQKRPTRRYVDFCMARVRLLRHHHIEPYLVFDGGPLPAKLGTEKEREKRREQNVKLANELSAQGKATQAADYYAKCVDVTPQMAYQVIKALKAENVQYVVAPYEADAQLAYLERAGLVDGIITEDSDLLVFGCRNVHVKLDTVSATVVSISRSDFGSSALASGSFSLVGWSEAQFRWMAMLSGCDYLPSIAGVGLKTAYQLLKKYKVVDKVVKMIRLEGKKSVPKDYVHAFYRAEMVFLHQRVYDPQQKKLVYLTNPSGGLCLSDAVEMYIGRDLEPSIASRIARGDVCPITLAEMDDINPSFAPKQSKARVLREHDANRSGTREGKAPCKNGGILSFFTPVSKPSPPSRACSLIPNQGDGRHNFAGNASGKRTLVDVMENDMAAKRKKIFSEVETERCSKANSSHFFNKSGYGSTVDTRIRPEKENAVPVSTQTPLDQNDPVTQEDGYLSPSPSLSRAGTPEISSPTLPCIKFQQHTRRVHDAPHSQDSQGTPSRASAERVLVRASSEPVPGDDEGRAPGPDLAIGLAEDEDEDEEADRRSEATSEIHCWEDDGIDSQEGALAASRSRAVTPLPSGKVVQTEAPEHPVVSRVASFGDPADELELLGIEEDDNWEREQAAFHARLAEKWRLTYSHGNHCGKDSDTPDTKADPIVSRKPEGRKFDRSATNSVPRSHACPTTKQTRVGSTWTYSVSHSSRSHASASGESLPRGGITLTRGSRVAPILIDVDGISDEIGSKTREMLHVFRFST